MEEYQKLKEGYKGLAIRNLSDVMSAMREGIGELGSSNGISGRSEWLVRNNGRRWQNWARGKSEDKIKSKAEGLFDGVKSNWVKQKFKYDSWFGEAR